MIFLWIYLIGLILSFSGIAMVGNFWLWAHIGLSIIWPVCLILVVFSLALDFLTWIYKKILWRSF